MAVVVIVVGKKFEDKSEITGTFVRSNSVIKLIFKFALLIAFLHGYTLRLLERLNRSKLLSEPTLTLGAQLLVTQYVVLAFLFKIYSPASNGSENTPNAGLPGMLLNEFAI
jgi:hypothetical protein